MASKKDTLKPGTVVKVARNLVSPNHDDAYEAVVSSVKCRNENHVAIIPKTRRGESPKPGVEIGVHRRRLSGGL